MKRLFERYPSTVSLVIFFALVSVVAAIAVRIALAIPFWVFVAVFGYVLYRRYRSRDDDVDG